MHDWLFRGWFGGLLLALATLGAHAQTYVNLGLEARANHGQPLALWSLSVPPDAQLAFDSTVVKQGRSSLRLALPTTESGPRSVYLSTNLLPLDSVRGRLIAVSVWVRTQGWRGTIRLGAAATATTSAGITTQTASALDSIATADWRRLELQIPVRAVAYSMQLALTLRGSGRVWLDDVQLRTRHQLLPELPVLAAEALLLPPAAVATTNWDFERPLPRATLPAPGVATAAPDSARPQHGRRYLRLARGSAPGQPAPALYLGALLLPRQEAGKTLRVMGYWRRLGAAAGQGTAPRFAHRLLSTRQRYGGKWLADTLSQSPPLPAPGPQWASFAFEVPLQFGFTGLTDPSIVGALALSMVLPDAEVVELDNLTFALDGKLYVPPGPPVPPPPTAEEQTWLRTALRPLRLATPATATPDLAALGAWLGTARLVGLGETTHGSHEVFGLHQRLSQYFIEQKNFTGLLLEASPAGCAALNDYLRTGQGNPAQLLAALEGWHTPEVLDLVRWLRARQQAYPATPLLLAGLDIRQPEQALTYLSGLLGPADEFAQPRLRQLTQLLASYRHPAAEEPDLQRQPDQPRDSLLAPLHRLLAELADGLATRTRLGRPVGAQLLARQRYYLRLVEQGATWRRLSLEAENYRQACLAENAYYLSQHEATGKLLLWAANTSVAKALTLEERPMGEWLRATLGPGYAALGVALGQGSFAARGAAGHWQPAPLVPARPGTYEAWLKTGPPAFWLNLKHLELSDANAWLFQPQLLRDIGYAETPNQLMLHNLRTEFDAVLFLRDSTPTQQLP